MTQKISKILLFCMINTIFLPWMMIQAPAQPVSEVTLPGTELRPVQSDILGQEIDLYVRFPGSYHRDTSRIYPVIYATDANRSFPMMENIFSMLETAPSPYEEVVLIGIGYRTTNLAEWAAWRTRDLTPVNVPATDKYWADMLTKMSGRTVEVKSGGAAKFLDCIIQEIIPFAETHYRISKTDRGLFGYSYGGLFSLYALFSHPDAFQRYFAGSPSIHHGDGYLFRLEEELAATHPDLHGKLFMTAGSLEDARMTGNMKKMADLLQSRNYPNLKVSYRIIDDQDHQSASPDAITRAIKVLYLKQ